MLAHPQTMVDDLSSAVDAGRRRLAKVNLKALQESAKSVAHSALPTVIAAPPARRRRWPIAGFLVVIGVAVLGYLYMNHLNPMIRRRATGEDAGANPNFHPADPTTTDGLWVEDDGQPDPTIDLEHLPGTTLAAQ